jgi:hypothetical protein
MKPSSPPIVKSPGALWLKREAELESALIAATCMMRDLVNGWPIDELCQSPEEALTTLDRPVPNHEVMPL